MSDVYIIDDLSPEDVAMLQALYSRSGESVRVHLEKVRKTGSGKFMESFYVGYNHKSIGDCGTTTVFLEDVSLLAAKAVQDNPLYNGQETSTRYIDMGARRIVDPIGNTASAAILAAWMDFYTGNQDRVAATVRERHPLNEGEDPKVYERAVKARTFDILRGFLPAGITTQLSWHTNLRQAADCLLPLCWHPSREISNLGWSVSSELVAKYPSSGFQSEPKSTLQEAWMAQVQQAFAYQPSRVHVGGEHVSFSTTIHEDNIHRYGAILSTRPRNTKIPHFLTDLGQCHFDFLLDFGSWRDIQRQRNGVCRMPLLTTGYGFEPWYLDQIDKALIEDAVRLISRQAVRVEELTDDKVVRQYYTALGFRVPTSLTYALPASVYVVELRTGKMIHPSLRKKTLRMAEHLQHAFPTLKLHIDGDPDDWSVRRGMQTITAK